MTAQPGIVVGVDGSESSIEALRWAGRLAAGLGAQIEAVTSWATPATYGFGIPPIEWNPQRRRQPRPGRVSPPSLPLINTPPGRSGPAGLRVHRRR